MREVVVSGDWNGVLGGKGSRESTVTKKPAGCWPLHQVSKRQLHLILKTRLLVIAAASTLYRTLERKLWRKHRRRLSLLKFMTYLAASPLNLQRVIDSAGASTTASDKLERALVRYCCHDEAPR